MTAKVAAPSRWKVMAVLGVGAVALSFASVLIRRTEAPSLVIAAGRLVVASLVLAPFFARQFLKERKTPVCLRNNLPETKLLPQNSSARIWR